MTEQNDPIGAPPAQPVAAPYPQVGPTYGQPGVAAGYGQPWAEPGYGHPGAAGPIQPPLPPPPPGSSEPGAWVPPLPPLPPPGRGGGRAGLVVGAVAAALLLLGGGFAVGRTTAPSTPSGPASLMDALRMAQQGTLPCGSPPRDGLGVFVQRLCRDGRAVPGGTGPGVPGGSGTAT